jgi:signal peptidase I
MSRHRRSGWADTVKTVLWAGAIALVVRTVAFEPFNIPSGSMKPTLLVGDYLFVSKYSYGYSRYSLPLGLPLIPGRILFSEPERGDVAVFKLPADNKTDYIKRIIGLPGDRIQVRDGILHINGKAVERRRIADYVDDGGVRANRLARFIETLPNGKQHEIIEVSDNARYDNTTVYTVPPGHYFAMGDNRDNSLDSRVSPDVGFIPKENLVGRAEILFFSTDGSASLWEPWKWPGSIRYGRLFNIIE